MGYIGLGLICTGDIPFIRPRGLLSDNPPKRMEGGQHYHTLNTIHTHLRRCSSFMSRMLLRGKQRVHRKTAKRKWSERCWNECIFDRGRDLSGRRKQQLQHSPHSRKHWPSHTHCPSHNTLPIRPLRRPHGPTGVCVTGMKSAQYIIKLLRPECSI